MSREQILIHRARELRDHEAFATLVHMHQGKLRGFLMRLTHQHDLSDDLAQESFIKAFERLGSYKGTGSFSGWLFQIAFNTFLQHRRASKRREEMSQAFACEQGLLVEYYESMSPEQYDLELALLSLKPEQAAAITLCHSYGYSHREVAQILGIPIGTVKTNILRGKEQLRARLATTERTAKQG